MTRIFRSVRALDGIFETNRRHWAHARQQTDNVWGLRKNTPTTLFVHSYQILRLHGFLEIRMSTLCGVCSTLHGTSRWVGTAFCPSGRDCQCILRELYLYIGISLVTNKLYNGPARVSRVWLSQSTINFASEHTEVQVSTIKIKRCKRTRRTPEVHK